MLLFEDKTRWCAFQKSLNFLEIFSNDFTLPSPQKNDGFPNSFFDLLLSFFFNLSCIAHKYQVRSINSPKKYFKFKDMFWDSAIGLRDDLTQENMFWPLSSLLCEFFLGMD